MNVDEQHKLAAALAFLERVANPPEGLGPIEAISREGDKWWAVTLLAEVERLRTIEARAQRHWHLGGTAGAVAATILYGKDAERG